MSEKRNSVANDSKETRVAEHGLLVSFLMPIFIRKLILHFQRMNGTEKIHTNLKAYSIIQKKILFHVLDKL